MKARESIHGALFAVLLCAAAVADDFPAPQNTEKATDNPLPPDEVVKTAKLPPGFQLSVFAAEPHVQNPIAITTDARGRLWVAENYSWAGAEGGFLPQHRDRIVIFEDVDDDGRVLSGVVSEKTDRTLTLQTLQEPLTIDRREIEISKQTTNSLMPDGLLLNLSDAQVRDLMAYLMSTNQVPLRDE